MGIIKADQPFAVRTMQRQGIVQSMGPLRRHWYARDHEPYPVATLRIDHEHRAIEVNQRIQARVGRHCHF